MFYDFLCYPAGSLYPVLSKAKIYPENGSNSHAPGVVFFLIAKRYIESCKDISSARRISKIRERIYIDVALCPTNRILSIYRLKAIRYIALSGNSIYAALPHSICLLGSKREMRKSCAEGAYRSEAISHASAYFANPPGFISLSGSARQIPICCIHYIKNHPVVQ